MQDPFDTQATGAAHSDRFTNFIAELNSPQVRQHCFVSRDPLFAARKLSLIYGVKEWYRPLFEAQTSTYNDQVLSRPIDLIIGHRASLQIEIVKLETHEKNVFNCDTHSDLLFFHHFGIPVAKRRYCLRSLAAIGIEPVQTTELILSHRHHAKILCAYFDFGEELNLKVELIESRIHGFNSRLRRWPQMIGRMFYGDKMFEKVDI